MLVFEKKKNFKVKYDVLSHDATIHRDTTGVWANQIDTYNIKIGLCAQYILTILSSTVNILGWHIMIT